MISFKRKSSFVVKSGRQPPNPKSTRNRTPENHQVNAKPTPAGPCSIYSKNKLGNVRGWNKSAA